jgi:hypothetical protein
VSDPFATGFVERLQAQWPDVDVHAHAAIVREWHDRGGVRNPSGLLVDQVMKAVADMAKSTTAEQERYAELNVRVYRELATRKLSPVQLAELLEGLAKGGCKRLNPRTPALLRRMGDTWPGTP